MRSGTDPDDTPGPFGAGGSSRRAVPTRGPSLAPDQRRLLAVLFVGVLMSALDVAIVGPALPALREAFGVDERLLAWTFMAFTLFNLLGNPVMARLSDGWGRRRVYVVDIGLFAAGSILVAAAPAFRWLLVGRAVQGLGAGGIFPVAAATIGDVLPVERRGRALGLIGAVFGIAFLIGPLFAGIVLQFASWRWLFALNLPIAAMVAFAAWRTLPDVRQPARRAVDVGGVAALGVFLAAIGWSVNRLELAGALDARGVAEAGVGFVVAGCAVAALIVVERRAALPVLRLDLLRRRPLAVAMALACGTGLAEAAVVFVPQLLVRVFDVTKSEASYMLLPIVLAMALGAPLAGRWVDRVGSRPVVVLGCACLLGGMLLAGLVGAPGAEGTLARLLPMLDARGRDLGHFYAGAALIGLGLATLLGGPLRYVVLAAAPAGDRAGAQGMLALFIGAGQLLGGAFVGAAIGSHGGGLDGYRLAFVAIAVVAAGMVGLTLALPGRGAERSALSAG